MEPRPIRRGNITPSVRLCRALNGFNGATSNQTWKPWRKTVACPLQWRFNGATSNQTWKRVAQPDVRQPRRGFNGATSNQTWKLLILCPASSHHSGFNGATSNQTWKRQTRRRENLRLAGLQWSHVQSDVETSQRATRPNDTQLASMEPRPIRRGNNIRRLSRRIHRWWLQWSHVQSDVETSHILLLFWQDFPGAFASGGRKWF